jgi:predicted adenylyl cyclase CyaB
MPRNIEIKARIADVAALLSKVQAIADQGPVEIKQDDTFFACASGRLKLRAFSGGEGELIYYRRSDERGPKESSYVRAPTSAPGPLRQALTLAYGQTGHVQKRRTLYLAARVRIHIDQVIDLGDFLELEVVLEDHEAADIGIREANDLLRRLGVDSSQLVAGAYVDLLAART